MKVLIVEDEELAVKKITKTLAEVDADAVDNGVTDSIQGTVELAAGKFFTGPDTDGY